MSASRKLSANGQAAVEYAKRGLHIFPLRADTKAGHYLERGHLNALNDLQQVEAWWSHWPDANIGLNLAKSGLVAADADRYKPDCGWDVFRETHDVPQTWTQATPSGGEHHIFLANDNWRYPGRLCAGVDIKHNGYILLAPSSFKGNAYRVLNDVEPAAAPDWLGAPNPASPSTPANDNASQADLFRVRARLRNYPNTLDRDTWVRLGLALKAAYGDAIRDDFLAYSYRWPDTVEGDPERVWDSAKPNGQVGAATAHFILRAENVDQGELTESGVATTFAARYGDVARFDHDQGCWMFWDNDRWSRDTTQKAFARCRDIARELSEPEAGAKRYSARKAAFTSGALFFAKSEQQVAVTSEIWDQDPYLIGCPGTVVNLRTGALLPPEPDQYITKRVAVAPLAEPCPAWLSFLDEATGGDEDLQRFLRQWCGYCLTGGTSEQALLFIYGPGGNGKTVFLDLLVHILGDYAKTAPMETFAASKYDRHPAELAMLRGARLVSASETEAGRKWAETRIKQLTGGDRISARFMRRDFFTFKPQFKMTLAGNHCPSLTNVDDAMRRRFNIVPFTIKPKKPDPELSEKLKAEAPQILHWMIEGCLDWQQNGLVRPGAVNRATAEYFDGEDLIGQFIDQCCVVDRNDPNCMETSAALYAAWCGFAIGNGYERGSQKAFGETIRKRGFSSTRKRSGRGWQGIKLIDHQPLPGMPM